MAFFWSYPCFSHHTGVADMAPRQGRTSSRVVKVEATWQGCLFISERSWVNRMINVGRRKHALHASFICGVVLPSECKLQLRPDIINSGSRATEGVWLNREVPVNWEASATGTSNSETRISLQPEPSQLQDSIPVREGSNEAVLPELKGLCVAGRLEEAMDVIRCMDKKGIIPSTDDYEHLLKCCTRMQALGMGRHVHAHMMQNGLESDMDLVNAAINMFVKCGSLPDAVTVFNCSPPGNVFAWSALISGHTNAGQSREALRVYQLMQKQNIKPTRDTFLGVLKACSSLADLEEAKQIHADISKSGWRSDIFIDTTVVDMYVKCGSMLDAQDVFDGMSLRNVVSWYVMIAGYVQQEQGENVLQLYHQMREEGVSPHDRIFVSVLKGCGCLAAREPWTSVHGQSLKVASLGKFKGIQAEALKLGYDSYIYVATTLVDMYAKCGSIEDAQCVFDAMPQVNVVSWNAMIGGYSNLALPEKALELYVQMRHEGVVPNNRTLVSILQACGSLAAEEEEKLVEGQLARLSSLGQGKSIHAEINRMGLESNAFVGNTTVHMYAKCGSLVDAHHMFDRLALQDVISWNVILSGYAQQGKGDRALQLYCEMQEAGINPDKWTFVGVLQACGGLAALEEEACIDGQSVRQSCLWKGKIVHGEILTRGLESDQFIATTLVDMYGKCGSPADSEHVFDKLLHPEVVTWNALIAGYAEQDHAERAFHVYSQMQEEGAKPDESTFLSLLKASSNVGSLSMCCQLHSDIVGSKLQLSVNLANTLIHAYGKCGSTADARKVFESLPERDVVSWNAMMIAYARKGEYLMSLRCFKEMQEEGVTPDEHTFLSVLASCGHAGMVDRGLQYFTSMCRDYNITATPFHWACLVDLLGRAGLLKEAEDLILRTPEQSITMWLSLLGACRIYHNLEIGKRAFDCAIRLDPKRSSAYMLMANIYSCANMGDDVKNIFKMKTEACAWKKPGQSWIEDGDAVHLFLVEDMKHDQAERIHQTLIELSLQMRKLGLFVG